MAEQRLKEIGIRKTLGASIPDIVTLLSKEFLRMVTLANIIAWPVAYHFMKKWPQNFAYRTRIGVDVFLLSAFMALFVSAITVSFQSIKAATANPIDSLRYE